MEGKEKTPGQIVGENVKALREARLYSRADLAELSGISHPSVVRMEEGGTPHPRRGTVQKVADALDVPIERLLEGVPDAPKAEAPSPKAKTKAQSGIFVGGRRITGEALASSEAKAKLDELYDLRGSDRLTAEERADRLAELLLRLQDRAERPEAAKDVG